MRKNMKKLTVATVIGAMTVTALAPVSAQAKDKTLTVAIWDNGQKAGLQEIMDEFTKETGIKTELQVVEWSSYWTLLEAGASGGDMPDVFWMHSNEAVRYMSNDILLDLTDKIADSDKLEMDKFPKDIKEMYQWDGKTYAVPKDIDTIAMWYNKDMFDEAGIDYPDVTVSSWFVLQPFRCRCYPSTIGCVSILLPIDRPRIAVRRFPRR